MAALSYQKLGVALSAVSPLFKWKNLMYDGILIITLCSLPCFAGGLALYRMAQHGQAIKKLARGTIPSITQSAELTSFTKQMSKRFSAFELCSFFAFAWVAMSFVVLFLCSSLLSLSTSLVLYACYAAVGIIQSLGKQHEKATVHKIMKSHPSFVRLELLQQLQGLQKSQKQHSATLTLKLGDTSSASAGPQRTLAEENMLKRAHQDALNDGTLAVDEPMIVIFKSKEQVLTVFLSKAELVWQPTVDESGNDVAGRVFCAGVNFSGARIAHFDRLAWPETQVNAFTHGWIATRERAHILLSTLWWLSDDQRIVIYELINPGQPFPIDWLPTAASRGSWQ